MAKPKLHTGKNGGIFYFAAVFSSILVSSALLQVTIQAMPVAALPRLLLLFGSGLLGAFLFRITIGGHLEVGIHELKHLVVSRLVGNKSKSLKVGSQTGSYEYTFTDETAHYNALISLAPYFFPLLTLLVLGLVFAAPVSPSWRPVLVACVLGGEILLHIRDAGSHQTDFTNLRGGYLLGTAYVAATNLIAVLLLILWAIHGAQMWVVILGALDRAVFWLTKLL